MTHLARIASLVLAFYLLTSAATAYAECAWVLWEWNQPDDNPANAKLNGWTPLTVHRTQEVCETVLNLVMQKRDKDIDRVTGPIPAEKKDRPLKEILTPQALNLSVWLMLKDWRCLPDTVDPRGPKEK